MRRVSHYFVYVGNSTATKNKLQDDFQKYLHTLSAVLISADKLEELKKNILDKAIELNELHSRCTPLKLSIAGCYSNKGLMINGFHSLVFQILNAYDNN
jgi:hypothetical protein